MLDTKLILVEGIPGSGKSTTAQWIALDLQKRQIDVDWFMDEHRNNPVTIWDDLSPGSFITRTLENWKRLTQITESSTQIVVLEGCLLQLNLLLGKSYVEEMPISDSEYQLQWVITHPLFGETFAYSGHFALVP